MQAQQNDKALEQMTGSILDVQVQDPLRVEEVKPKRNVHCHKLPPACSNRDAQHLALRCVHIVTSNQVY